MTLILRPVGRGNWNTMTMRLDADMGFLALIRVGERISLGGITWRVCEVKA